MGAKFAPSVANLYMARWEEEGVLDNLDPRVMLYRHFIDDLLLIWRGTVEDVESLLHSMNSNDQNISLT